MSKRNELVDYAETVVLPSGAGASAPGGAADGHSLLASDANAWYEEYLRSLASLPVLRDVVAEPPRVVVRDFRLGQRPDGRKRPREDAYALREQHAGELDHCYNEYAEGRPAVAVKPAVTPKSPRNKKGSKARKRGKPRRR